MHTDDSSPDKLVAPDHFSFPFTPYPIQLKFMTVLYETLEEGKLGIFESPTGTGKSLSIACSSIQWLKDDAARKVNSLVKKLDEITLKQSSVNNGNADDWIMEQYTNRLHHEEKNQVLEQLNSINKRKDRINDNKTRRKNYKHISKGISQTKTEKKVDDDTAEDAEFILCEDEIDVEDGTINLEENELENRPTQILFCSRTHSQLSQMVSEIAKSPHNDIRVVSLASRQTYCINDSVRSLKHISAINEKCLDLQKNKGSKTTKTDEDKKIVKRKKITSTKSCVYKNAANVDNLRDAIVSEIIDVEDLVKEGKTLSACPYYATRISLEDAEFITLPYQTLLSKKTRKMSGIEIKNNIIIIDEAHNLLDTISSLHSTLLTFSQLKFAQKALKGYQKKYGKLLSPKNFLTLSQLLYVNKQLLNIFEKTDCDKIFTLEGFTAYGEFDNINVFPLIQFCEKNNFAQKVAGFANRYPNELDEIIQKKADNKGVKAFLNQIENYAPNVNKTKTEQQCNTEVKRDISRASESAWKEELILSPISCLYSLLSFLERLTDKCEDGRILITNGISESKRSIKYLLLNPGAHFQDIVKEARSVIVAGGTMQPLTDFKIQLFGQAESHRVNEFSCGHVVSSDSICPIIMTKGPSGKNLLFNYSNRGNSELLKELSMIIQNTCNVTPGGIVCFFPSYDYEQQVHEFLLKNNILTNIEKKKTIFREPKNSKDIEQVLQKYAKCINEARSKKSSVGLTGALMLGVVGGKISEGLNFSDDLGRCVIVVGMPYPNKNNIELSERMNFLNTNLGNNAGNTYYENLCFKAVNQCIGRAIRHINDYSAIILLDERYSKNTNREKLSGWIQSSLKVPQNFGQCHALLSSFFNKRKC